MGKGARRDLPMRCGNAVEQQVNQVESYQEPQPPLQSVYASVICVCAGGGGLSRGERDDSP